VQMLGREHPDATPSGECVPGPPGNRRRGVCGER
jgi:hypothetical protein